MSDLPKKAEDKVNVFGVILIGIVSAVLVWVSVVALQAYYKNTAGPVEELREAEGKNAEVRALKAGWTAELQKTEYADAKKGLLKRLPIERAMELVVRDANEGAESLVPRLGNHDKPTVPAVFGKPADDATVEPAAPGVPMIDPGTGEPMIDPATGEPIMVDPATGEPITADPVAGGAAGTVPAGDPAADTDGPAGGGAPAPAPGAAPSPDTSPTPAPRPDPEPADGGTGAN